MICSLCVYELQDAHSIHLDDDGESKYLKIIAKRMPSVELINSNNNGAKNICMECSRHLDDFQNFCDFVEERQKNLEPTNLLDIEIPIDQEELLKENQTFVAEASVYENDDQKLQTVKSETQEEEEEKLSNNICSDFLSASSDGDIASESIENDEFLAAESQGNPEEQKQIVLRQRPKKASLSSNKTTTKRNAKKTVKSKQTKLVSDKNAEKNEDMLLNEQLISQNLSLLCEICHAVEPTFSKLQIHYRVSHKVKGYLKCCERRFTKRSRLCEHLKLHLNPEIYKCKICNRNMKTAYSLQKHRQDVHPKEEDLKFECNICGKKNANKHSAQRHREKHDNASEFCAQCGKSFKTKYSLEHHIKAIHEQNINPYICDTCGKEYKCKTSFVLHVAEHQGPVQIKLVQCEVCQEWVRRLDRHMYKHNTVDVVCKLCGKQVASKSSLRYHMDRAHKPVQDLPCTLCGRIFKYKKNLKEHMAMHTNTKDYRCQHCDREFRSSANMYAHIKRDHVEQWLQARNERKKGPPEDFTQETTESLI